MGGTFTRCHLQVWYDTARETAISRHDWTGRTVPASRVSIGVSLIPRVLRVASPGLLMAGMAIGVSHLVQSTRAGAGFGFQLIGLVIAVNLAKYPFFEYGHRYAAATGESLLHGYRRLGRGALLAFFVINIVTSIIGTAAVVFVTAALAQNLLRFGLNTTEWSALLIAVSFALLVAGRFKSLDIAVKLMIAVLAVSTVVAFIAAAWHGPVAPEGFQGPSPWRAVHLGFLIALMGWMPGIIEVSIFQSLWLVAGDKASERRTSVAEARLDFNISYGFTTLLAVVFLALGALVMYGSGEVFAESAVGFAANFVTLYASTLGDWIRPLMAVVALVAMLSTTLTVIDAAPRSMAVAQQLLQKREGVDYRRLQTVWMVGIGVAALVIISAFRARFTQLIDLATIFSFLAAPVFAYLNMRVVSSEHVPVDARPGPLIRMMAVFGLLYLAGFGILYLVVRIVGIGAS